MGKQTGGHIGVSGVSIVTPAPADGTITVQDEGVVISNKVTTLNFVGADVSAVGSDELVTIYIPALAFASHYNTTDGTTTGTVSESGLFRTATHISSPTTEGNPFATGGWAGTNQSTTKYNSPTFTTGGAITGLGGNAYFVMEFLDADGVTVLHTTTTSSIIGNGLYGDASINLTVTSYAPDAMKFKGVISVTANANTIFAANSRDGGRYSVRVTNYTDTTTDGTGPYIYTQTAVFLDTNPTTPSIGGPVSMAETLGSIVTKHLSGIEYYAQNSQFTATILDIDQLNRNTSRTTGNLSISGGNFQVGNLTQSPFGAGSVYFSGWTNDFNQDNVDYTKTDWAITSSSARFRGTNASISATAVDPWGSGSAVSSGNSSILIDTYGVTSSNLIEDFDDEDRRQDSTWNTGNPAGNWNSVSSLVSGEAMIMDGKLMSPEVAYLTSGAVTTDWSPFKPDATGSNPNYTGLTAPVNYYRTIVDTTGLNQSSFTMTFTGAFVANATTDLANSDLEIFISRRASASGGFSGYNNPNLLLMHGANYNFATFDDGVTDGHIREASSSGSTVNCTFGGFSCEDGFFMHIRINNPVIKIDRIAVTFF